MESYTTVAKPVLWILLACLLHHVTCQTNCPNKCQCTTQPGGVIVNCERSSLTSLPTDIPVNVIELNLRHNNLTSLRQSDFPKRLGTLVKLDLSFNQIQTFETAVRNQLPNMKILDLSNNSISHLPLNMFSGYTLDRLYLSGNTFEYLSGNVFKGASVKTLIMNNSKLKILSTQSFQSLKSSLTTLLMSGNLFLAFIPDTTFSGFTFKQFVLRNNGIKNWGFLKNVQATELDLSGNSAFSLNTASLTNLLHTTSLHMDNMGIGSLNSDFLSNLDNLKSLSLAKNNLYELNSQVFNHVTKLTSLDLSGNDLYELPADFGRHLENLTTLTLSDNSLETIEARSLQGMSKLTTVKLSNNRLQVLHENMSAVLDRVSLVAMDGNPIHCNCEMRWFREYLAKSGKLTGADRCHSPESLAMKYILDVNAEQFVCRKPTIINRSPNITVHENDTFFLTCTAEGDPAPEVHWESALDDVITITPPIDRTKTKTVAVWQIHRIKLDHGGVHRCTAVSVAGKSVVDVYVTVLPFGATLPTTSTSTKTTTTMQTTTMGKTTNTPSSTTPTTITTTMEVTTEISETTSEYSETKETTSPSIEITSSSSSPLSSRSTTAHQQREETTESEITSETTQSDDDLEGATLTPSDVTQAGKNRQNPLSAEKDFPVHYIIVIAVAAILVVTIIISLILICQIRKRLYTKEYDVSTLDLAKKKTANVV